MDRDKVIVELAENKPLFGIVSNPEIITPIGGESVMAIAGFHRLGTQRVYGRNGTQLVGETYDGDVCIILASVNPQFAKAIKKCLPANNECPKSGVSIKWANMDVWAETVDTYRGLSKL